MSYARLNLPGVRNLHDVELHFYSAICPAAESFSFIVYRPREDREDIDGKDRS